VAHQLIFSAGGFVVLAGTNAAPSDIILFKVDIDGEMLWAKQFQFSPPIISSIQVDRGNAQIQEIGGNLYITATGVNTNGSTDILIIKTDVEKQISLA
jgi:hypothetical protein